MGWEATAKARRTATDDASVVRRRRGRAALRWLWCTLRDHTSLSTFHLAATHRHPPGAAELLAGLQHATAAARPAALPPLEIRLPHAATAATAVTPSVISPRKPTAISSSINCRRQAAVCKPVDALPHPRSRSRSRTTRSHASRKWPLSPTAGVAASAAPRDTSRRAPRIADLMVGAAEEQKASSRPAPTRSPCGVSTSASTQRGDRPDAFLAYLRSDRHLETLELRFTKIEAGGGALALRSPTIRRSPASTSRENWLEGKAGGAALASLLAGRVGLRSLELRNNYELKGEGILKLIMSSASASACSAAAARRGITHGRPPCPHGPSRRQPAPLAKARASGASRAPTSLRLDQNDWMATSTVSRAEPSRGGIPAAA